VTFRIKAISIGLVVVSLTVVGIRRA